MRSDLNEMREKEQRVRELMDKESLDAVAICNTGNFAWLTCGGSNHVGLATEVGAATAVVTRDAKFVICDNIEAPRMFDEEVGGLGFKLASFDWFEGNRDGIIREIVGSGAIGSDVPMVGAKSIASALDPCRYSLTPQEIERYERIGAWTGAALAESCREIEPGMTEHEIAGVMCGKIAARGMVSTVALVAVDERIERYRHPIPTDRKLERYAMLVIGARKWGLIVSATRLVSFGALSPELRRRHDAVARVDATFISATVPGASVSAIFGQAVDAYASAGFPDEWKLHHQGGPTGYRGRDFRASLHTDSIVQENQAFAWNPSITGTKCEDTIIATSSGPRIISASPDWPTVDVELTDRAISRPDILVA